MAYSVGRNTEFVLERRREQSDFVVMYMMFSLDINKIMILSVT